jgi:predicted ribosomally synthesized peptide with SipW-like signal peptide
MEISKKKLFATLFVIGLVAVLVTGATYTWLSDREEISWTITVKTADLEAPASITFPSEIAPGESISMDILVKNVGEVTLVVSLYGKPEDPKWITFTFDPNNFDLDPGYSQFVKVTATLSGEFKTSGETLTGTIIVDGVQKH